MRSKHRTVCDPEKRAMTTGDVARLFCISPRMVVKLCDHHGLPFYRIGAHRRFLRVVVLEFAAKRGIPVDAPAGRESGAAA